MGMKYKGMTWGQMEAVVNKLGGRKGVEDFLAGRLVVKPQQQAFKVLVDCSKTVEEMIKAGEYSWVNDNIINDHFSIEGSDQKEVEITLFHFSRGISSDGAIIEMEKAGFRPARIEELLALGTEYKELQKQFLVVALGSSWRSPEDGNRYVVYLYRHAAERTLDLYRFGHGWVEDWRFAVVRK